MVAQYDVPYMERTRNFYRAQGYTSDYRWAQHDKVPFNALDIPLKEAKVAVITTTMPDTDLGRTKRQVHSTASDPIPTSMYTDDLSWHKTITHTDDVASFLPLQQLRQCQQQNLIGAIAEHLYSLPTEYSQRNTIEKDAPEILTRCRKENVDVAILVPL